MGNMITTDPERPNVLCAIPLAGLALTTAISLETGISAFYTRKEPIIYRDLGAQEGLKLHSLATIREATGWLYELGTLTSEMYDTIVENLDNILLFFE